MKNTLIMKDIVKKYTTYIGINTSTKLTTCIYSKSLKTETTRANNLWHIKFWKKITLTKCFKQKTCTSHKKLITSDLLFARRQKKIDWLIIKMRTKANIDTFQVLLTTMTSLFCQTWIDIAFIKQSFLFLYIVWKNPKNYKLSNFEENDIRTKWHLLHMQYQHQKLL